MSIVWTSRRVPWIFQAWKGTGTISGCFCPGSVLLSCLCVHSLTISHPRIFSCQLWAITQETSNSRYTSISWVPDLFVQLLREYFLPGVLQTSQTLSSNLPTYLSWTGFSSYIPHLINDLFIHCWLLWILSPCIQRRFPSQLFLAL